MKKRKILKILFVMFLIFAVVAGLILALRAYGRRAFEGLFHCDYYQRDSLTAEETAKLAEAFDLRPEDIGEVTLYKAQRCFQTVDCCIFFIAKANPERIDALIENGAQVEQHLYKENGMSWTILCVEEYDFNYWERIDLDPFRAIYRLTNDEGYLFYYSGQDSMEYLFPGD